MDVHDEDEDDEGEEEGEDISVGDTEDDEDDEDDEDEGLDDEEEEDDDPEAYEKMIQALKDDNKSKGRNVKAKQQLLSEAYPESEFNLNPGAGTGDDDTAGQLRYTLCQSKC